MEGNERLECGALTGPHDEQARGVLGDMGWLEVHEMAHYTPYLFFFFFFFLGGRATLDGTSSKRSACLRTSSQI